MTLAALLLLASGSPLIADLDTAAQARDVGTILDVCAQPLKANSESFRFLKNNGCYGVGRFGWHAFPLTTPKTKRSYVVFSTPLTTEDMGEQVYLMKGQELQKKIEESDGGGYRIVYHQFEVSFVLGDKIASIRDRATFVRANGAPAGDEPMLRMSPTYRVKSIFSADGKARAFSQAGGVTVVDASGLGDKFDLQLDYSGIVNQPRYAGSIGPSEATLTNDYWYPMIARGPASYHMKMTVPAGWTVITQGEPVRLDVPAGDGRLFEYDMKLPCVYFSATAGPFKIGETSSGGLKFLTWAQGMPPQQMQLQNEFNRGVISFYSDTFAPYPFKQWGSLISPGYGGGALEAYSYATYGTGWLPDEDAHEPAHTWWGGILPNSYLKSLWNESFAVYSEGVFGRNVKIGSTEDRKSAFVSTPSSSPVYQIATCADSPPIIGPAASALGYGKGAFVLQMLEREVGFEAMKGAMRHWIASHKSGENADWEDFERAFAESTKLDMRWFFDQWLRRKGYADFDIQNVEWKDGAVVGAVSWTSPVYRIKLEAYVRYADGTSAMVSTRIGEPGSEQILKLPLAKKPELVSFDPERVILRPIQRDEEPVSIQRSLGSMRRYTDPAHADWLTNAGPRGKIDEVPADPAGVFFVGSPETVPAIKALCDKAGFAVSGDKLTYRGTTIDLKAGSAIAIIDLPDGKLCAIGLGKTIARPAPGRAKVALTDNYGRFLRGETLPKTAGRFVYKL